MPPSMENNRRINRFSGPPPFCRPSLGCLTDAIFCRHLHPSSRKNFQGQRCRKSIYYNHHDHRPHRRRSLSTCQRCPFLTIALQSWRLADHSSVTSTTTLFTARCSIIPFPRHCFRNQFIVKPLPHESFRGTVECGDIRNKTSSWP